MKIIVEEIGTIFTWRLLIKILKQKYYFTFCNENSKIKRIQLIFIFVIEQYIYTLFVNLLNDSKRIRLLIHIFNVKSTISFELYRMAVQKDDFPSGQLKLFQTLCFITSLLLFKGYPNVL